MYEVIEITGLQNAGPLRVLVAPSRYVQGPGALRLLADQLEILGIKRPMAMGGPTATALTKHFIETSLADKDLETAHWVEFKRECTWDNINLMAEECKANECDAIISIGGGKAIDCGKAAAAGLVIDIGKNPAERLENFGAGVPLIAIPTIASTSSACSTISTVYNWDHEYQTFLVYPTNPTMVLVDSTLIAKAPVRFVVSGMGDTLATWFEADMTYRTNSKNIPQGGLSGGKPTMQALATAKLCYDILRLNGIQAKQAAERSEVTPALENVIEANILLSCIGYESGGVSAAHAIHNGLTNLEDIMNDLSGPPRRRVMHGELVAFGTLCQMVLEDRNPNFIKDVMGWCKTIGLPTGFKELGYPDIYEDALERLAHKCATDVLFSTMNQAFSEPLYGEFYSWEAIKGAMKEVDTMSEAFPDIHDPGVEIGLPPIRSGVF